MKKYLFTGLLTFLPLTLTFIVVVYLFDLLTEPFVGIANSFLIEYEQSLGLDPVTHPKIVLFIGRLSALIFIFVIIFLLGFFGRKFFIHSLLKLTNKIFSRIPIIKSIYRISADVTKAFFSPGEKTFKKTVLVPFLNKDTYAMGFVTNQAPPEMKKVISELEISVFVPTAPHPMSGFILITNNKNLVDVDISIQESFKFLVSCGTIHPKEAVKENEPH